MLNDEELLRDTRSASELRRGLLAGSIIRMAYLRGLGKFRRVSEAVAAIAADQARQALSATVPVAMIREEVGKALETAGKPDVEVELHSTIAHAVLGHLAARRCVTYPGTVA